MYALRIVPQTVELLEPFANVRAWMERIEAFGHGTFTDYSGAEAVETARRATPITEPASDPGEPNGLSPGDRVEVVGEVVVHFPREHYRVLRV